MRTSVRVVGVSSENGSLMSDFAIYWKNYSQDIRNCAFGPSNPLADWRSNSDRLHKQLKLGARLWFFAAGESCNGNIGTAAYLVNVFRVREVVDNSGDDPEYPTEEFRYTIWSEPDGCVWISPPAMADQIVRPAGHQIEVHIGKLMQGPRRLPEEKVIDLEALVDSASMSRLRESL